MLYNKDTKLAYIAETSDGKDEETYERVMEKLKKRGFIFEDLN